MDFQKWEAVLLKLCHWKQTSEEGEVSGCAVHPWVSPPVPFRYNYTMKMNTEIRFIPNGSEFFICLFMVSVNLLQSRSLESTAGGNKGH